MNPEPTQEILNRYLKLLSEMDFYWRQSDDHRFTERWIDSENEIERLRVVFDQDNKIYNVYSPFKK